MARARNIKPGFFRNADLVELPMEARLLFIGLWTLADRAGRLEDRPKQIKMEIFPADSVDCDELLALLSATGMLERYEVGGKRFLQVVNFAKHQNPHRDEKVSTIPDSCGNQDTLEPAPTKHSASTVQAQCKQSAATVPIGLNPESGFLNPDPRSLIPDSLGGGGAPELSPTGSPPPFFMEFIKAERPDLNPKAVLANFQEHFPPDKCTYSAWKKWVRKEHVGKVVGAPFVAGSAVLDPDSRASIEAVAVALGIGFWVETVEQWATYKARVRAAQNGAPA